MALAVVAQPGHLDGRPSAPPALSFNEHIRPILSDNCYRCHGPDASSREAELRLDHRDAALEAAAFVPGKPDESELVRRVFDADPENRMPPPTAHRTLTGHQKHTLRRWVAEGAHYQDHWSFIASARPVVPAVAAAASAQTRNPIDAFVVERLAHEGRTLQPQAARAALLRRVTYDLTGLPPTPSEAAAFLADASPGAYERVVERLLASPRYGEHRARYWLDVARYGDTHGLHRDELRHIWPYRDYVVRAYNANLPYDQFVREQLAGDLLYPETVDPIVATGFVRAGISSNEGGAVIEELRVNNLRERTEALGAAFLGLTIGCAACHDHKFDPLIQRDFYRLGAFFNNLAESPSNDNRADWPPFVRVPKPSNRAAHDRALAQRSEVQRKLDARRAQAPALLASWLQDQAHGPGAVDPADLHVRLRFNEQSGTVFANDAPGAEVKTFASTGTPPTWGEETWLWSSMRMETGTQLHLGAAGDFDANQPFTVGMWLMPRLEAGAANKLALIGAVVARVDAEQDNRGWEIFCDRGRIVFTLARSRKVQSRHEKYDDEDAAPPEAPPPAKRRGAGSEPTPIVDGNALSIATTQPKLRRGQWNHILVSYDGSGRAAGMRIYLRPRSQHRSLTVWLT